MGLIVFGTRLFGRVLTVPGVLHVATQFFHIYYVPLLPMRTVVVLASGEVLELQSLSWTSILMAWFRVLAWAVAVGALVVASVWFGLDQRPKAGAALALAALCVACFFASYWTSRATRDQLDDLKRAGVPRDLLAKAESALTP